MGSTKRSTSSEGATRLNKLEHAIVAAEDGAEDARWSQAEEVVRLIDKAGLSQRDIAADWINLRTGRSYSQAHVKFCAKVWREYHGTQDRPWFADAYQAAKGTTAAEAREVQAPASEETAEKLVQNLLAKAPDTVVDTVFHGLKLARQGKYAPPAERKAREAKGRVTLKPLRQAVAALTAIGVVGSINDATEELREMIGDEALTDDIFRQIEEANAEWQQELVVARAMFGMDAEEII